jgi:hypothetical protein
MNLVKSKIISLIGRTDLFALYALRRSGYLAEMGWFQSFKTGRSVDRDGKPIPWITYPALAFLAARLTKDMSVFEYGAGNSTLWLAARVKDVVCCEHDAHWYSQIRALLPPNARIELCALDEGYAEFVTRQGRLFDMVLVDGRARNKALAAAVTCLTPGGFIVLDNAERAEYIEGIEHVLSKGFRTLPFDGAGPIVTFLSRTTIFYRTGSNCLGI